MAKSTIDQLIINPPYEEPKQYWSYDRETRLFALKDGRRPAGCHACFVCSVLILFTKTITKMKRLLQKRLRKNELS